MPTERDVYSGLFQASTEATEAGILTDELSELLEDLIAARDERLLGAYDDFMRSGNRRVLLKRLGLIAEITWEEANEEDEDLDNSQFPTSSIMAVPSQFHTDTNALAESSLLGAAVDLAFDAMDSNHNGVLDRAEFNRGLLGQPGTTSANGSRRGSSDQASQRRGSQPTLAGKSRRGSTDVAENPAGGPSAGELAANAALEAAAKKQAAEEEAALQAEADEALAQQAAEEAARKAAAEETARQALEDAAKKAAAEEAAKRAAEEDAKREEERAAAARAAQLAAEEEAARKAAEEAARRAAEEQAARKAAEEAAALKAAEEAAARERAVAEEAARLAEEAAAREKEARQAAADEAAAREREAQWEAQQTAARERQAQQVAEAAAQREAEEAAARKAAEDAAREEAEAEAARRAAEEAMARRIAEEAAARKAAEEAIAARELAAAQQALAAQQAADEEAARIAEEAAAEEAAMQRRLEDDRRRHEEEEKRRLEDEKQREADRCAAAQEAEAAKRKAMQDAREEAARQDLARKEAETKDLAALLAQKEAARQEMEREVGRIAQENAAAMERAAAAKRVQQEQAAAVPPPNDNNWPADLNARAVQGLEDSMNADLAARQAAEDSARRRIEDEVDRRGQDDRSNNAGPGMLGTAEDDESRWKKAAQDEVANTVAALRAAQDASGTQPPLPQGKLGEATKAALGNAPTGSKLDQMFDQMDSNKDGVLDRDEFAAAMSADDSLAASLTAGGGSNLDAATAVELEKFNELEEETLVELFQAYAGGGSAYLDESKFCHLFLELFATSLISQAPCCDSCREQLRDAVNSGHMEHGIGFASPMFWRSFQFFDTDKSGQVSLLQFARGMHQICYGSLSERAYYVFFVSDTENKGFLTEEVVLEFFTNFMELFSDLSINVLSVEQPHLLAAGVELSQIEEHVASIRSCLKSSDELIMTQFEETFRLLDTVCKAGKPLTYDLWLENRKSLPKMYNKALNLVRGVLNQHTAMFHNPHLLPR